MKSALTRTERLVLQAIYEFRQQFGRFPEPGRVAILTKRTSQANSMTLRDLISKGYLEKIGGVHQFTTVAREFLAADGLLGRVEIPIYGHVYAGSGKSELEDPDLSVHFTDGDVPLVPLIDQPSGCKLVALQVDGQSLEHEGIFAGDLVIVQTFSEGEQPKDGQLIVTDYIDFRDVQLDEFADHDGDPIFHGPVLKFIYYKENHVRLGWRTDLTRSQYTLRAAQIRPYGKVVGLYRRLHEGPSQGMVKSSSSRGERTSSRRFDGGA